MHVCIIVGGIRSRSASQNMASSTKVNLTNNAFVQNTHGEVLDLRGNTLQLLVISENWCALPHRFFSVANAEKPKPYCTVLY